MALGFMLLCRMKALKIAVEMNETVHPLQSSFPVCLQTQHDKDLHLVTLLIFFPPAHHG